MPRLLLAALILGGLLYFGLPAFVDTYTLPGGAMQPTLHPGDYLLTKRMAYDVHLGPFRVFSLRDPQHNDVAVFRNPREPSKVFIKRVIGVPGDTIEIKDKRVYRNGEPLAEPFIRHSDPNTQSGPRDNKAPVTLLEEQYFMMGDDRDDSLDSRFLGPVPRDHFLGKAWFLYAQNNGTGLHFGNLGKLIR